MGWWLSLPICSSFASSFLVLFLFAWRTVVGVVLALVVVPVVTILIAAAIITVLSLFILFRVMYLRPVVMFYDGGMGDGDGPSPHKMLGGAREGQGRHRRQMLPSSELRAHATGGAVRRIRDRNGGMVRGVWGGISPAGRRRRRESGHGLHPSSSKREGSASL